jgi:serine phosphatase RsbU (regulator of sigma subunit)/anti-sigma regulatory factor (Ser/Thr protein kinase)
VTSLPFGSKSALARYLFAVLVTVAGLIATIALLGVSDEVIYAPLLGSVLLAAWYGGFGPALVALLGGWALSLWLAVEPRGTFEMRDGGELARWWVNFAVAALIAIIATILRFGRQRAVTEASDATALGRETERLVHVTTALLAAVSSADVAEVLSVQSSDLLGAQGGALGLIEANDLVIVDPTGLAAEVRTDGDRIPLERATLLTHAAREGSVAIALDRTMLEQTYPDSAKTLPIEVEAAIALPVRAERKVVGAIGFLFDRGHAVTESAEALASVVAELAGQALERARLYERERESRQALERILQVAPRFLRDDAGGDDVTRAICREARTTFGADYGVLWRLRGGELHLLAIDPPRPSLAFARLPLDDFPRLREAVRGQGTSFVSDALETTYGRGLDFVRDLGIRSSLRTPVVIAGASELVLAISWHVVISEPEPATLAVVRRFADQAGLTIEQLERRRAEAEASARADATRRLQDVTAALSRATTTVDVSNTCLEHALEAVGAEAGFVVLSRSEGTTVEIVTSSGYDDDELEAWRGFGPDDDVPFARALASGEPVWAFTAEEMSAFTGVAEPRSAGWVTIPLMARDGAVGALHVSLRTPRTLSEREREWLQTMVSQCSQAVQRSSLYEEEQRSRRRAERLQTMTAELSNALTTADVARVVVDAVGGAVDADAVGLTAIDGHEHTAGPLAWYGECEEEVAPLLAGATSSETPAGWAIRARRPLLFDSASAVVDEFPSVADEVEHARQQAFFFVPLVAGRRANAVLLVSWGEQYRLSRDDRALVEALASQAAQALDRARHFESEQTIAETLQRSVLPVALPRVEGVQLAARYLPGSAQLDVGGDWFDAITLSDGRLGLVVGDVVGKGVQAAASMAQLRNAIRAFSVDPLKPSSVLARLNRLAEDALDTTFATLVYMILDPETGVCRLASAGHPPPVVAFPDGRVELLEGGRGLPLGTGIESRYRQDTYELPAGSTVVLYTDGLVERRGRSIDEGLADLRSAVGGAPKDPDRLLEHVLERVVGGGERGDDIALLAARVLTVAPRELDLTVRADLGSMDLVRDALRVWLEGAPVGRADAEDVVLASWEACANAIEHAVDPREGTVRVRAALDDSRIRVSVTDTGGWAPSSTRRDRGLGLRLMRALSSSVEVAQHAEGTTVTMEKALTGSAPPRA